MLPKCHAQCPSPIIRPNSRLLGILAESKAHSRILLQAPTKNEKNRKNMPTVKMIFLLQKKKSRNAGEPAERISQVTGSRHRAGVEHQAVALHVGAWFALNETRQSGDTGLWDEGVYPHLCDARESPLHGGVSL